MFEAIRGFIERVNDRLAQERARAAGGEANVRPNPLLSRDSWASWDDRDRSRRSDSEPEERSEPDQGPDPDPGGGSD